MSRLEKKLSLSITAGHEPLTLIEKMDILSHVECNRRVDEILEERGKLGRLISWVDKKVAHLIQSFLGEVGSLPESPSKN